MTHLPKSAVRLSFLLIALLALPLAAHGQESSPPLEAAQIDQMVAPIALYPDTLVAQILMAATYPLEVVEASRWLQEPQNAQLQGDYLTNALELQDWDPSVKALIAFPQVLSMMNENLEWTERLGDAFLAQQADLMDSVQRLRQLARNSGHLTSTPQQTVVSNGGVISIEPATPEVVYVPYYVPTVVYGAWPYPAYQPYYFPRAGIYYNTAGRITFGARVIVINWLWDWGRWDWRHHRIDIDDRRFARVNHGLPPPVPGVWRHEPEHRRNVPYHNADVHRQFQPTRAPQPERVVHEPYILQQAPKPLVKEQPSPVIRREEPRHEVQPSPVIRRDEPRHEVRPSPVIRQEDPRHEARPSPVMRQEDPRHEARPAGLLQRQPDPKVQTPLVIQPRHKQKSQMPENVQPQSRHEPRPAGLIQRQPEIKRQAPSVNHREHEKTDKANPSPEFRDHQE